jgi:hypothetical protein
MVEEQQGLQQQPQYLSNRVTVQPWLGPPGGIRLTPKAAFLMHRPSSTRTAVPASLVRTLVEQV